MTSSDPYVVRDSDASAFYPNIILNLGLYPQHIGPGFLTIYRNLVDRRLAAKRAGDKVTNDALKIVINGSSGKLGSKWSKLYSPELLIRTTVTGQLSLLMLIERMEIAGFTVISANTDGIAIKFRRSQEASVDAIIRQWEKETGFSMEHTEYRALYSKNVNNYLAIKPNGDVKTKGVFAPAGLSKNPTNTICVEAVTEFLTKGTPIHETVRLCRDIRKFVTIRNVKGGAEKDGRYLGKVVRFYYATGVTGTITYKENGNTVARSEGAKPCMDLPAEFPSDINYDWYITEAREMLSAVGYNNLFI